MGPWAQWTAKTALLAAGFAAAVGGLSGVVDAACQVGTAVLPPGALAQTGRVCQRHTRPVCLVVALQGQNVRTGRMIRLRRVAFLLPSALSESLDSSQSPYSAWSVRILRAASRASRDVPRGRYTTR